VRRRPLLLGLAASGLVADHAATAQRARIPPGETYDLTFPPLQALNPEVPFGTLQPSAAQIRRAQEIIDASPRGPRPVDVAQSFVDRFARSDPEAISQWPAPKPWNPLVVAFFRATAIVANSDMIPWCAAFVNFCIERAGGSGSGSASSQSFLLSRFAHTREPRDGDLAIFTCFDTTSGESIGLGHVTFYRGARDGDRIAVVGGNQTANGHSSIISAADMHTGDRAIRRRVPIGALAPAVMRLNAYIRLA
jgi:uncharacterized protein (TIGR02594 family)